MTRITADLSSQHGFWDVLLLLFDICCWNVVCVLVPFLLWALGFSATSLLGGQSSLDMLWNWILCQAWCPRLWLHCEQMSLLDLEGQRHDLRAPLPVDLWKVLEKLEAPINWEPTCSVDIMEVTFGQHICFLIFAFNFFMIETGSFFYRGGCSEEIQVFNISGQGADSSWSRLFFRSFSVFVALCVERSYPDNWSTQEHPKRPTSNARMDTWKMEAPSPPNEWKPSLTRKRRCQTSSKYMGLTTNMTYPLPKVLVKMIFLFPRWPNYVI